MSSKSEEVIDYNHEGTRMDVLVRGVMRVVLFIVLVVWAIVGFIFWIPLLIRATTIFSASLAHSAITGQKPANLSQGLEAAAGFWFGGFRSAIAIFSGDRLRTTDSKDIRLFQLLFEIMWASIIWITILAVMSPEFGKELISLARSLLQATSSSPRLLE